jgi:oligopeptidase B
VKGWLIWLERADALPRLCLRNLITRADHVIAFAEEAYALSFDAGLEFETTSIRFSYASPATPDETWELDLASFERRLLKRAEIPSGHNPADYKVRRLFALAPDGEEVPITLLTRADAPAGIKPLYLLGYGSYGFAMTADFEPDHLSLVDRGFAVALAHIRGGQERGRRWYEAGRLMHKQNTFSDFIAVAQHLIAAGETETGRIVAHGRSAGGLLMGAVANQAPQLFAGIIAEVPFVDVMNTMLDETLPLTPGEWSEWGDPIRNESAFKTMLAYSPYDNIAENPYPAILALAGVSDPRVTYWEPAKWIAKLRNVALGGPFLLKTDLNAGHGGKPGRFSSLDEPALILAFAIACVSR